MKTILSILPDLGDSHGNSWGIRSADYFRPPKASFQLAVVSPKGPLPLSKGEILGSGRLVDPSALFNLRKLVRKVRPELIHLYGITTLRLFAAAVGGTSSRIVVHLDDHARLGFLDRWLLRGADTVVVASAPLVRRLTPILRADKIVQISPGVSPDSVEPHQELPFEVTPRTKILACVGPFESHKNYLDAVWAFAILHYVCADPHLIMIGDGSDLPKLTSFAASVGVGNRVHFVGRQQDVRSWLARADVAWVPCRRAGGVQAGIEAMSVGVPVVASVNGGMSDIIRDGDTGFLVRPGDKVAMGRQTRILLEDRERRDKMGKNARIVACKQFSNDVLMQRLATLYGVSTCEQTC